MKALILAAGFGTRLGKDLRNDTSGAYSHLVGQLRCACLANALSLNYFGFRLYSYRFLYVSEFDVIYRCTKAVTANRKEAFDFALA